MEELAGHAVPQLLGSHDPLGVIEMTVVRRPWLLDFGKAALDWPPDFEPGAWETWRAEKAEVFGRFWPKVVELMGLLEARYGIYLLDANFGNIGFPEMGPGGYSSPGVGGSA